MASGRQKTMGVPVTFALKKITKWQVQECGQSRTRSSGLSPYSHLSLLTHQSQTQTDMSYPKTGDLRSGQEFFPAV